MEELNMFYKGGMRVEPGTYWDVKKYSRIDAAADSILPGAGDRYYLKASTATILIATPVIGLLFAVLLPFLGIATATFLYVRRVFKGAADSMAKSMSFGWKPLEASLADKKKKEEVRITYANVNEILEALHGKRNQNDDRNNHDMK
jgi:hypothetical protein